MALAFHDDALVVLHHHAPRHGVVERSVALLAPEEGEFRLFALRDVTAVPMTRREFPKRFGPPLFPCPGASGRLRSGSHPKLRAVDVRLAVDVAATASRARRAVLGWMCRSHAAAEMVIVSSSSRATLFRAGPGGCTVSEAMSQSPDAVAAALQRHGKKGLVLLNVPADRRLERHFRARADHQRAPVPPSGRSVMVHSTSRSEPLRQRIRPSVRSGTPFESASRIRRTCGASSAGRSSR